MSDGFYIVWGLILVVIFFASRSFPRQAWAARRDFVQFWGFLGFVLALLLYGLIVWLTGK
jgi:predicted ferric reductase